MRSISLRATVRLATIGAISGCILILVIVVGAYYTLERAEGQVGFANGLISDAGKLNLLTAELMVHRSDRATSQWNSLHNILIRRIADAPAKQGEVAIITHEVTERLKAVKTLIERMDKMMSPGEGGNTKTGEAAEILRSAIIAQSQAILERASELHDMMTATAARMRHYALLVLGCVFFLFLIGGGVALLLLSKGMLADILRLRSTIQELGQGDLDTEIPDSVPNEIGDVFAELDGMRRNLLDSMGELSRANLELISIKSKLEDRTVSLETVNRELESFTSTVSHDLRAPLRSVMGFSEAILEDFSQALDKEGRDMLGRINRAARQMYELIDDLLRLSKLGREKLHITEVSLSALAEDICRTMQERNPDREEQVTIAPDMIVQCDEQLITIALTNLLDNAWKFTSRTADPHIEIGCEAAGGDQQFFVQDNGVGFDMGFSQNLFQPFKRLHSAAEFPGTGIGLAIVARIVNLHGGTVLATGSPGQGARFTFRLGKPASSVLADAVEPQTAPEMARPLPVPVMQRAKRAGGRP